MYIRINDDVIDLIEGHQPSYGFIYSLGPVKLETLKFYIETNLANNFIKLSKFLPGALIIYIKADSSLWL